MKQSKMQRKMHYSFKIFVHFNLLFTDETMVSTCYPIIYRKAKSVVSNYYTKKRGPGSLEVKFVVVNTTSIDLGLMTSRSSALVPH